MEARIQEIIDAARSCGVRRGQAVVAPLSAVAEHMQLARNALQAREESYSRALVKAAGENRLSHVLLPAQRNPNGTIRPMVAGGTGLIAIPSAAPRTVVPPPVTALDGFGRLPGGCQAFHASILSVSHALGVPLYALSCTAHPGLSQDIHIYPLAFPEQEPSVDVIVEAILAQHERFGPNFVREASATANVRPSTDIPVSIRWDPDSSWEDAIMPTRIGGPTLGSGKEPSFIGPAGLRILAVHDGTRVLRPPLILQRNPRASAAYLQGILRRVIA